MQWRHILLAITAMLLLPSFAAAASMTVRRGVIQVQTNPETGEYQQYQVAWDQPFADSNYAAVCNVVALGLSKGSFPLWISSKATDSVSVEIAFTSEFFGDYASVPMTEIDCLGVEGSDGAGQITYGFGSGSMVGISGAGAVTFQAPLNSSNYSVACSAEAPTESYDSDTFELFVQVSTAAKSTQSVGIVLGGIASGADGSVYPIDCIAADANATILKAATNTGLTVTWANPFSDSGYAAACTVNSTADLEIGSAVPDLVSKTSTSVTIAPSDGTAAINDYECIAGQNSSYRIVDPYAGGALIASPTSVALNPGSTDLTQFIVSLRSDVAGVAADGAAHVLIILNTTGTSVTFTAPPGQGCFFSVSDSHLPRNCNDSTSAASNPSTPVTPANGYAIVGYIAPQDYATSGSALDTSTARTIQITTTGDPANTTINMQIVRPPQFLIHGLWSGPDTWDKFAKAEGGMCSFRADYKDINGKGLSITVPRAGMELQYYLWTFRNSMKVAVSQMDIVAHSMGGLIARSIANSSTYKTKDNYMQGPIHKLITVGTPFAGSPFADNLVQEYIQPDGCSMVKYVFPAIGNEIDGAIQALETTAPRVPSPKDLPTHAIVGVAGSQVEQSNENTKFYAMLMTSCAYMNLQDGYEGVFGEDSDLIVGASSQAYGFSGTSKEQLSGTIHTSNNPFLFPAGQPELQYLGSDSDAPFFSRVIVLLNSSVGGPAFETALPQ